TVAANTPDTTVTVPGITTVVGSGLHKIARYDEERGIDTLELKRITADAADQRAGRAGRLAPGVVWRLWDSRDRLRPHREPELHGVDLSATALDVIAWDGDPRTLEWFERPRDEAIEAALRLLERLGATRDGKLTTLGQQVQRLPIHPRLACMLLAAGRAREMARAGAPGVLLASATGASSPPESGGREGELLVAVDVVAPVEASLQRVPRVPKNVPHESRIRIASLVDREWLEPNRSEIVHRFDRDAG